MPAELNQGARLPGCVQRKTQRRGQEQLEVQTVEHMAWRMEVGVEVLRAVKMVGALVVEEWVATTGTGPTAVARAVTERAVEKAAVEKAAVEKAAVEGVRGDQGDGGGGDGGGGEGDRITAAGLTSMNGIIP
jgi:hypothetical protein